MVINKISVKHIILDINYNDIYYDSISKFICSDKERVDKIKLELELELEFGY